LIYSFGVSALIDFEIGISQLHTGCEIHLFDPKPSVGEFIRTQQPQQLPQEVIFHDQNGLAGKDVRTMKVDGVPIRLMALDEIMELLGHDQVEIVKVEIDGLELNSQLFDLEEPFKWGNVGQLVIGIHGSGRNETEILRLHKRITSLGFVLFHKEQNLYHLEKWTFSYLNPKVMGEALGVPYTEDMIKAAESQLSGEIFKVIEQAKQQSLECDWCFRHVPFIYFYTHPNYHDCDWLQTLPTNQYHALCWDHLFSSSGFITSLLRKSRPVTIYWIDDTLSANQSPYQLKFLKRVPNAIVHTWTPPETVPSKPLDRRLHHKAFDDATLFDLNYQANVDVIHLAVANGVDGVLKNLLAIERLKTADRPIQLLVEVSLCWYQSIPDNYGKTRKKEKKEKTN